MPFELMGINLQQKSLPSWLEALYKQLGTLGQKEALFSLSGLYG